MERYIIALQRLGLKNEILIKLITQCTFTDIEQIFIDTKNSIFYTRIEFASLSTVCDDIENLNVALDYADKIIDANQKLDIKTAIYGQSNYPCNLQKIKNPPILLYYKGADITERYSKAIACVGTRRPTKLSYNIINYLIPQLVEEGYAVISGLALGSDRLAHIACLMSRGNTIAVLAHGLDQISPKKNKGIAEAILNNGGTLVSEYPVEVEPENFRYINRNRIIVGLSKGIIVSECALKSGTMHSVEFGMEQHKPIFCTDPGECVLEEQEGIKYLLKKEQAIKIPNGRAYNIIVNKTGYVCQSEKVSIDYIEEIYIKSLLFNIWDNKKIKNQIISNKNILIKNLLTDNICQEMVLDSDKNKKDFLDELLNICIKNRITE